jgi:transposase
MARPLVPDELWEVVQPLLPRHRARPGKRDGKGTALALRLTGAHRNESLEAMNLVDDIPPTQGRCRPRQKPKARYGDRQYGIPRNQEGLSARGIEDHLARQGTPQCSGLDKIPWVVERTRGWVGQDRRLKIRYDRLPSIHRLLLSPTGQDLLHGPAEGFL